MVNMEAGSGMQMPNDTAPSCDSLLYITLSVNCVASLQAVIRAGALKTGEISFGSERGHCTDHGIPCLTEAVLL